MIGSDSLIKLLVLDVLKPHKPNIVELGLHLSKTNSIECAEISVYAVDERTESIKITLEGKNIDFDEVRQTIEVNGAVVHSIDKVVMGKLPSRTK